MMTNHHVVLYPLSEEKNCKQHTLQGLMDERFTAGQKGE
jgi:hypothetical protein